MKNSHAYFLTVQNEHIGDDWWKRLVLHLNKILLKAFLE